MLITTDVLLGMRCPECGKLDYHQLSRFAFSGRKRVEIKCVCGATKLGITTRNRKDYLLRVPCVVCEISHSVAISSKMLWQGEVVYLLCQETGLDLGYLGPREDVLELSAAHEESMEAMVDEFEKEDDYFCNPEIMYEVLNRLHDIAEIGDLSCQCGNFGVDMDIFPDRIELQCQDCSGAKVFYASTEEDLIKIQDLKTIELKCSDYEYSDTVVNTGKAGKKNRHKRK